LKPVILIIATFSDLISKKSEKYPELYKASTAFLDSISFTINDVLISEAL